MDEVLLNAEVKMEKAITNLEHRFTTVRAGRGRRTRRQRPGSCRTAFPRKRHQPQSRPEGM